MIQKKIITGFPSTMTATYRSLTQALKRDRVTILQSIKSLVRYHYIEQKKQIPENEKSKVIFIPTFKGFGALWPGIDGKDIINTSRNDEIIEYVQFVNNVFVPLQQAERMLRLLFGRLAEGYLTDYELDIEDKKNLIKKAFRSGLLESIQHEDYNTRFLSKSETRKWLNKIYSFEELREIKDHLIRMRNNCATTIENFP